MMMKTLGGKIERESADFKIQRRKRKRNNS